LGEVQELRAIPTEQHFRLTAESIRVLTKPNISVKLRHGHSGGRSKATLSNDATKQKMVTYQGKCERVARGVLNFEEAQATAANPERPTPVRA
jgi:hypothetical protein